jgi:MFS superfamily sulfate permease-like transporter
VIAFQAPLSLLNAYPFRHDVLEILREAPKPVELVVLEASAIPEIDFTAAQALKTLIRYCQKKNVVRDVFSQNPFVLLLRLVHGLHNRRPFF